MLGKLRKFMWNKLCRHFHQERDLDAQIRNVTVAALEVHEAKKNFDKVVAEAYTDDQFRKFAEGARASRF
jgi:hypothetical protein